MTIMTRVETGRAEMSQMPEKMHDLILDEGPFPRHLVETWPENLQNDYLELLGLDLQTLGLEEFRRMGRALGEAYLLSLDRPIESEPHLLEAWRALTGNSSPPKPPEFLEI